MSASSQEPTPAGGARTGAVPSSTAASGTTQAASGTDAAPQTRVARLFDLRWVIAGLLGFYGVVLVIRGVLDGSAQLQKAAGVRINLWTGIGLLVIGLLFALWAAVRPLQPPAPDEIDADLTKPPDAS